MARAPGVLVFLAHLLLPGRGISKLHKYHHSFLVGPMPDFFYFSVETAVKVTVSFIYVSLSSVSYRCYKYFIKLFLAFVFITYWVLKFVPMSISLIVSRVSFSLDCLYIFFSSFVVLSLNSLLSLVLA